MSCCAFTQIYSEYSRQFTSLTDYKQIREIMLTVLSYRTVSTKMSDGTFLNIFEIYRKCQRILDISLPLRNRTEFGQKSLHKYPNFPGTSFNFVAMYLENVMNHVCILLPLVL